MDYKVIKSNRKTISLSVDDNLMPVVRAPLFADDSKIDSFVKSNSLWLDKTIEKKRRQLEKYNLTADELKDLIENAKNYIPLRAEYFSKLMGLKPTAVKITCAKKRFGSCSGKNSLCFSCYLMLYPSEAIDYVIVHELSHIKFHNHSSNFYNLVASYLPDYKDRERLLKK